MTSIEAVSVINNYLLFADKIILELRDLLADDVQLTWFGKTITGKTEVAKFITRMKQEYHSFTDIIPISELTYKTIMNRMTKKTDKSCLHKTEPFTSYKNVMDVELRSDSHVTTLVGEEDCDISEIVKEQCLSDDEGESEKIDTEIKDQSYHLDDQLLRDLFEFKIMSQAVQNTNRAELKEEVAPPTGTAIARECGQGDRPVIANSMRYVQAIGAMRYFKQSMSKDSPFAYYWSNISIRKSWKRRCTLLIGYSLLTNSKRCSTTQGESEPPVKKTPPSKVIPGLEEILENWSYSISNNHFGGCLKPLKNFDEDREELIKSFEAELQIKNYIKTFNWEDFKNKKRDVRPLNVCYRENKFDVNNSLREPVKINYQIHAIVYCKYIKKE